MSNHDSYFEYLQQRSGLGLWYRRTLLYPRLCRYLQGRVLDVGCGIGDMLKFRPGTSGVDINPKLVALCRRQGLDVYLMEVDHLPFPTGTFDGAILDNVLEHIESPAPLLSEIRRVLMPGGVLVVGVPGQSGYASDSDHKKYYTEGALKNCMADAGFASELMFHVPFRSNVLNAKLRIYAVYGVFRAT